MASGCSDGEGDAGAGPDGGVGPDGGPDDPQPFQFARCDASRGPLPPLVEDRRVYQQETADVLTASLTITDLTGFAAVNANIPGATVRVHFTDGVFGAGTTEPNGTLKIRGGMSRLNEQKNYKIQLDEGIGRWRNQKEINLNKHMTDMTRMRNKIAFDLFQTVPNLTSLRTHYVHLQVNGESYGVYTWIEEPDKRFLASHGLDPDGQLYKAVNFNFGTITPEEAAMLHTSVEAKANADDAKFLQMVAAVNDDGLTHAEVIDRYFNKDNLATWLAANILLNNVDTRTQNFYIYSPSSCDGWYLLPWDYDGAFDFYAQPDGTDNTRQRWERGLANQWSMDVFERFYADPSNVALIDQKIRELAAGQLTEAKISERIAAYKPLVAPFVAAAPDVLYMPYGNDNPTTATTVWEGEIDRIRGTPGRFLAEYEESLERPMPVFMAAAPATGGMKFQWDPSFDLQRDPIAYDVQVATSAAFTPDSLVAQRLGVTGNEVTIPGLASGTYVWRIVIRDTMHADAWQLPYDHHEQVIVP